MILSEAKITNYKSVENSTKAPIDSHSTVLVGKNESGKSAFLEALHKARSARSGVEYSEISDYPRKDWVSYKRSEKKDVVATLTYKMQSDSVARINNRLEYDLVSEGATFSVEYKYGSEYSVSLSLDEKGYVEHLSQQDAFPTSVDVPEENTVRGLIEELKVADLNETEKQFLEDLKGRFTEAPSEWSSDLTHYVWDALLEPHIPKFLYFAKYMMLPGRVNIPALHDRKRKGNLKENDKTVLALLSMADLNLDELQEQSAYEESKATLEAISNHITEEVLQYWGQSDDIRVQIDIDEDPKAPAPYNSGANLYIRIENMRHRVTMPFDQQSRGFRWFFSFLTWFESVSEQVGEENLILLLDEPGLNLHATAQKDLLNYIDDLSESHQVLYTTHSPFMVDSNNLERARVVEDRKEEGTLVSSEISGTDPETLFPLQAALGYTVAQNLFIADRNLLVEGPSDLVFLNHMSSLLEGRGKEGLHEEVTIVPAGGLGNISTFVSLLHGNELEFAVVHDYEGYPDQQLKELVKRKLLDESRVLHYGRFRESERDGTPSTDVEDLFTEEAYLELFNRTYEDALNELIRVDDLPPGDRIVERIRRCLRNENISVRPSDGYNHYLVARNLSEQGLPRDLVSDKMTGRFERLFSRVNELLS